MAIESSYARMRLPIGPILHRFGDLTSFMCSWPDPTRIPP